MASPKGILKIPVPLGPDRYEVMVGAGMLSLIGEQMRTLSLGEKVAVVSHPKIEALYGRKVRRSLISSGYKPITLCLPDGERYKTFKRVEEIHDQLIVNRFERKSSLLALGGGVIGDITGFAAATFLRGIPYIQVPTTLVAQVDAAIGGKTGVDHRLGKNLIGAFHQPRWVCADLETLKTLPRREFIAGLAEVVKYGVILDAGLFEYLEANTLPLLAMKRDVLEHVVVTSASLKAKVVVTDEKESGRRKILNYGHTIGHVIETLTGYRKFKHGEAVAMGMLFAARLGVFLGTCDEEVVLRQSRLLELLGLPVILPKLDPEAILEGVQRDKKVAGGQVFFVLPEKIGMVRVEGVEQKTLKRFLTDSRRVSHD